MLNTTSHVLLLGTNVHMWLWMIIDSWSFLVEIYMLIRWRTVLLLLIALRLLLLWTQTQKDQESIIIHNHM
jgi:hypothetical protein